MSNKKVELLLDKEKFSEYLGLDNIQDSVIKLVLEIPDDKKNLEAIVKSDVIIDWNFIEEKELVPDKKGEEENPGLLKLLGIEKDYNKIAWLVEAVWKVSQTSPNLRFSVEPNSLFVVAVKKEFNKKEISSNHTINAFLCEIRYRIWDLSEIDCDLTSRLQKSWQGMGKMTLTDLAKELYER